MTNRLPEEDPAAPPDSGVPLPEQVRDARILFHLRGLVELLLPGQEIHAELLSVPGPLGQCSGVPTQRALISVVRAQQRRVFSHSIQITP